MPEQSSLGSLIAKKARLEKEAEEVKDEAYLLIEGLYAKAPQGLVPYFRNWGNALGSLFTDGTSSWAPVPFENGGNRGYMTLAEVHAHGAKLKAAWADQVYVELGPAKIGDSGGGDVPFRFKPVFKE